MAIFFILCFGTVVPVPNTTEPALSQRYPIFLWKRDPMNNAILNNVNFQLIRIKKINLLVELSVKLLKKLQRQKISKKNALSGWGMLWAV